MIGLDLNILIRYLTQDDPAQSAKGTEILERRLTAKNPGFVSVVTMVETVSLLRSNACCRLSVAVRKARRQRPHAER
jgi:predicted nucleic-acid-binding protein